MSRFVDRLSFEVEPATDGKVRIILTELLRYVDSQGRLFTVPAGFRCDLASIPKIFRSLSTSWAQSSRPGTVHDALYRWGPEVWKIFRWEADQLYMVMLMDEGVSRWRAWLQKTAVRVGASGPWKRYREMPKSQKGPKPPPLTRRA